MTTRPCKRRNSWHTYVVTEKDRGRAGAAAPTVENDVVDTDLEGRIDVIFDVLGRELVSDWNAPGTIPDLVGELFDLCRVGPFGKSRGRNGIFALRNAADLCDFALVLGAGKVAARSRFCPLSTFEMKGLYGCQLVP